MPARTGYSLIKMKTVSEELKAQETLTPTLLIGLGGTGGEVLLRVRKRLFERSKEGTIDEVPIISYLFIDTDATDKHIKAEYFEKTYNFKVNERLNATVENYPTIIDNLHSHPFIRPWWYPDQARLPGKDIDGGAGQIRGYARLAFFENFQTIKAAISNAISRSRGAETAKKAAEKGLQISQDLNIYVIASLAGGTGSGMIIDIGYLLHDLNLARCHPVAFLVFPRIFNLNEERIFYNSYAALKELEYFSQKDTAFSYKWEEQTPRNPITGLAPYELIYLVDGKNETALEISGDISRDSIFEMLAENIFQDFSTSAFANYKRAVRINLADYLSDKYVYLHRDPNDDTKVLQSEEFPCRYSTFGLATLSFPADRIINACAYKLAEDIMAFLRSGEKQDDLRNYVLDILRDRLKLHISQEGGEFQRNDLLDYLYSTREGAGETFGIRIDQWLALLRERINDGSAELESGSKADYIKDQVVGQERVYFKEDNPDERFWKEWGEIYRAIYQNREDLLKRIKKGLIGLIDEIINTENKGIHFAKVVLEEIVRVFEEDSLPYKPRLNKECQELAEMIGEDRETYQEFRDTLKGHELWGIIWPAPFLKGTTIKDDIRKTLEKIEILLKSIVKKRARQAAINVIDQTIEFIGKEGHIDTFTSRKEEGSGLLGELDRLDTTLETLTQRYRMQKESFRNPELNFLSFFVYRAEDLERRFYSKYIDQDKIGTFASEVLKNFQYGPEEKDKGISIMEIPSHLDQMGSEAFESELVRQTRKYFVQLKDDFDVLDMFYNLYKKQGERESILRDLYRKSKIWLEQSTTEGAFRLDVARKRYLVGISTKSPHFQNFRDLVKTLEVPGEPPINIFDTDIQHEVIFYHEAGGFPLSYTSSIYQLRNEYDKAESQRSLHLHIDKNDSKFKDVMAMSPREREDREFAIRVFLFGIILNIIKTKEDRDMKMYYYEERVGLKNVPHALGSEQRAIDMITMNAKTRDILDQTILEQSSKILSDDKKTKRFYTLLDWFISNLYIKEVTQDGGIPINKAPIEYRIIAEQMFDIESELKRKGIALDSFLKEVKELQNKLETFTVDVGDHRKALNI